ncbi:MAG TPA: TetR/AcrR family transcriptional regulator [Bacteroidales bacterium]|nr:TetR/AcrR family transcriptional regulator [Bacteroidales bacterium]
MKTKIVYSFLYDLFSGMDYRQRITEEAARLFRQYGIKAVTMDMLANNLGISKRTIYEVFKDKNELLAGVVSHMVIRQKELINRIFNESENVIEAIFRLLETMSEHIRRISPAFRLDMMKFSNDAIMDLKKTGHFPYPYSTPYLIENGIKEGVFRDDIDVEITNKCLFELIRMSDRGDDPEQDANHRMHVIRDVYINYLRGISTPKGLELINYYETHMIDQKPRHE